MMFLEHKYNLDELLAGCRQGKPKAQQLLYKLLASKMMGVCLRYAKDSMEAQDMLQNGFVKVFTKLNDFRGEGSFEGWVRRIVVHSSIEYHRKYHKMYLEPESKADEAFLVADNDALAALNAKDLLAMIQKLPPGYRLVFNLYAIEGYSHKEIGELAGITEGASKSQLSRARAILKEQVLKQEGARYENIG